MTCIPEIKSLIEKNLEEILEELLYLFELSEH